MSTPKLQVLGKFGGGVKSVNGISPDENGNVDIPNGGVAGISMEDDGNGNVTIKTVSGGSLSMTDDGNGNVTIGV